MFGATNLSVKRKGGMLAEVVKVIEEDTEDILLWPQNETSDTLRGTAICRAVQTLIYFRCYTVHVVELLNYYTNYCTYVKFIKFTH